MPEYFEMCRDSERYALIRTETLGAHGDEYMYHISRDKRSRQSAELIYKGLLECVAQKSFDLITISDLQKSSGVARTTFYRNFDNIADVPYWKCDTCFHEVLVENVSGMFANEMELAKKYFIYWTKHSDILDLLIKINRQDIIYDCHMKNADLLQKRFGALPYLPVAHGDYFMAIRTGFTISVLTAWIKGGRKESPDELVEIIQEQIRIIAREGV